MMTNSNFWWTSGNRASSLSSSKFNKLSRSTSTFLSYSNSHFLTHWTIKLMSKNSKSTSLWSKSSTSNWWEGSMIFTTMISKCNSSNNTLHRICTASISNRCLWDMATRSRCSSRWAQWECHSNRNSISKRWFHWQKSRYSTKYKLQMPATTTTLSPLARRAVFRIQQPRKIWSNNSNSSNFTQKPSKIISSRKTTFSSAFRNWSSFRPYSRNRGPWHNSKGIRKGIRWLRIKEPPLPIKERTHTSMSNISNNSTKSTLKTRASKTSEQAVIGHRKRISLRKNRQLMENKIQSKMKTIMRIKVRIIGTLTRFRKRLIS